MPISFNSIPADQRVPFVYVEFDSKNAQQGPSIQPYRILAIGQRLAAGTDAALTLSRITSSSQARSKYGPGSMLAQMCDKILQNNKSTELWAVPMDDDAAAVDAAGSIDFGGAATESGVLSVYVGGRRYRVSVDSADAAAAIATALVAEISDDDDAVVTAAVDGVDNTLVNITAKNGGAVGNEIDIRLNYYDGEKTPAGLTVAITDMAAGAANPDVAGVIAILAETQYNIIAFPYTDAANLLAIETELTDRWGPIRQNDGVALSAKRDTFGNLTTLGDSRNSKHVSIMGMDGPSSPWEWVGALAGRIALAAQIDPARPLQTLELSGILPPSESEQFTLTERNQLLNNGISTYGVDAGGTVRIERMITTYQTNVFGAPDIAFLNVNTVLTLSYLRYDFRNAFQLKFPNHKLANDGVNYGPGQAIVTPKVAKAESVAKFRQWEELGLVENIDQFKRDLIVERNVANPDRLDILLPPDLINQLIVTGVQIGFLL